MLVAHDASAIDIITIGLATEQLLAQLHEVLHPPAVVGGADVLDEQPAVWEMGGVLAAVDGKEARAAGHEVLQVQQLAQLVLHVHASRLQVVVVLILLEKDRKCW